MKRIILPLIVPLLFFSYVKSQNIDNIKLIRHYFDVYNEHQVDDILEMVSEDFKMYSISSDTITTDIEGKENLRNWLTKYFQDFPKVSSKISDVSESKNHVSFVETAQWGENKSQSSMAVYEFQNYKIHRVWYYY